MKKKIVKAATSPAKRAALKSLKVARASKPAPQPTPVGYVVRHSNEQDARPLLLSDYDGHPVLLIAEPDPGMIFGSWDAAFAAVKSTIDYEIANDFEWSLMYGDMLIAPVYL